MNTANALELKDLTKSYPGFRLDRVSLTLPSGCILGLVGENGAGKSTTVKLILNMLRKDGGTVTILGHTGDCTALRREEIGVVTDAAGFPECLTAAQIGRVMRRVFRSWQPAEYAALLRRFSLPEDKRFRELSRGMKMKLAIAVALSHQAKLLLLDEPTAGLDPIARDEVVTLLYDFTRDETHSVLISSHIVSDLEKLCDYIAFLHGGKLLLCEEKDQLLAEYGLLQCTAERLQSLPPDAVLYRKETPYGVRALVRRAAVRQDRVDPVSIEELFVFLAGEAE